MKHLSSEHCRGTSEPLRYGMPRWCDLFTPRQLLGHLTLIEGLNRLKSELLAELGADRGRAVITYLQFAIDKGLDYNSRQTRWHYSRGAVIGTFGRHDFSLKWTFGEMIFTGPNSGAAWALSQIVSVYKQICTYLKEVTPQVRSGELPLPTILNGTAAHMPCLADSSVDLVCMDPPYYDNVQYGELSDYFYVWQKRTLADLYPELFTRRLVDKSVEAVANPARDGSAKAAKLAYEQTMGQIFAECRRVLKDDGLMTLMFTHKTQEAWEALTRSLVESGWTITASFPVESEAAESIHQKNMASAASSIFLSCRKRALEHAAPALWTGLAGQGVQQQIRQAVKAALVEFAPLRLTPVDEMVAAYGRALRVLSQQWPVMDGDEAVGPVRAMNEASRVVAEHQIARVTRGRLAVDDLDPETARMRLLVGADLDPDDVRAIMQGDEARLTAILNADLGQAEPWPEGVRRGVELLAWMVAHGRLEVRVAFRVHARTGEPLAVDSLSDGYVHMKWAVFTDTQGDRLYASGSLNESRTALSLNAENIDVHCDWQGERDRRRVDEAAREFEVLWRNGHPAFRVLTLPEAVRQCLIGLAAGVTQPTEIDGSSAAPHTVPPPSALERLRFALLRDGPKLPRGRYVGLETAPITPWPHQAVVARRLIATWPYSYLLCDEVGLGKTIEAGLAIRSLYLSGLARRILICAPASLTRQWQREMASKFFLPFGRALGGSTARHEYLLPVPEERSSPSLYTPDLVIVSTGLLERRDRRPDLERLPSVDILLVDEAHYARRRNPTAGSRADPDYGYLYTIIRDSLRPRTRSLWLATATPMQLDAVEVADLVALTRHVGSVTSWYDLAGIRLDTEARLAQNAIEPLRQCLGVMARQEYAMTQAVPRIEALNEEAGRSQLLLAHLVARGLLRSRLQTGSSEALFWRESQALETICHGREQVRVRHIPSAIGQRLSGLLFDLDLPSIGDEGYVDAPPPLLHAALEAVCRTANGMKRRRADLSTADVLVRLEREIEHLFPLSLRERTG